MVLMGRGRAVALFSELGEIREEVVECRYLIYLLSCHFSQMNELNIFIALKINYLLSLGQL